MSELQDTKSSLNVPGVSQGIQSSDSFTTVIDESSEVWDSEDYSNFLEYYKDQFPYMFHNETLNFVGEVNSGTSSVCLSNTSDREQLIRSVISSIKNQMEKKPSNFLELKKSLTESSLPENVSENEEYNKKRYFERCVTIAYYQYLQQIIKAKIELENGSYRLFDPKNKIRYEPSFESEQSSSCFGNLFRIFKNKKSQKKIN